MADNATITPEILNPQDSKLRWGLHSMNSWESDFQGHCFNLVSLNGGGYKVRYFFDPTWEVLQFYRKPTVLADWEVVAETAGGLSDAKVLAERSLRELLSTVKADLLPCPFCQSDKAKVNHIPFCERWPDLYFVQCVVCEARIGAEVCPDDAETLWNTRAQGWMPIESAPKDGWFLAYKTDLFIALIEVFAFQRKARWFRTTSPPTGCPYPKAQRRERIPFRYDAALDRCLCSRHARPVCNSTWHVSHAAYSCMAKR